MFEDGHIEIHLLYGDFSFEYLNSGAQCCQGSTGLTIPREALMAGNKITINQHYRLDPFTQDMVGDDIPYAWKIKHKINPHAEGVADMIFNDEGLTLRQCFELRRSPWTIVPPPEPAP